MSRKLKYLEGEVITDPHQVIDELIAGRYIIENGKRQHHAWITSQPLHSILSATRRGAYRFAIPNPEHPDNKETP
jgi:hypothetical protein